METCEAPHVAPNAHVVICVPCLAWWTAVGSETSWVQERPRSSQGGRCVCGSCGHRASMGPGSWQKHPEVSDAALGWTQSLKCTGWRRKARGTRHMGRKPRAPGPRARPTATRWPSVWLELPCTLRADSSRGKWFFVRTVTALPRPAPRLLRGPGRPFHAPTAEAPTSRPAQGSAPRHLCQGTLPVPTEG